MATIKEINQIDLDDIMRMNRKELSKLTSTLASAANKRIRRLEQSGLDTSAYKWTRRSGGDFSVSGKNLNQLRSEFVRAKNFLNAKTSTHKGAKEVQREFETRIGGALPEGKEKDFWSIYNKAVEINPGWAAPSVSSALQQTIHELMVNYPDYTPDEILQSSVSGMNSLYESWQEEENAYWDEATEEGDDFFFM